CRYASGGFVLVKPLLPLGVPLAGVALFAVQVCTADDGAGAEGFCVGEGHGFFLRSSLSIFCDGLHWVRGSRHTLSSSSIKCENIISMRLSIIFLSSRIDLMTMQHA